MADLAPISPLASTPLVAISISSDGRVDVKCQIPKTEAVKLLLNIVEELRLQGFREESRLIQVARPA